MRPHLRSAKREISRFFSFLLLIVHKSLRGDSFGRWCLFGIYT
jgi:hypothetical protein